MNKRSLFESSLGEKSFSTDFTGERELVFSDVVTLFRFLRIPTWKICKRARILQDKEKKISPGQNKRVKGAVSSFVAGIPHHEKRTVRIPRPKCPGSKGWRGRFAMLDSWFRHERIMVRSQWPECSLKTAREPATNERLRVHQVLNSYLRTSKTIITPGLPRVVPGEARRVDS